MPQSRDRSVSRVAAICGLRAEVRIAERLFWKAACAGGDPGATGEAARRLVGEGATLLLSFGIAGGLDPALPPGTVVLADRVVVDGTPRDCLRLAGPPSGFRIAPVIGAAEPAATAARKRELFASGAAAVDLESGIVALVAAAAGLPFAVLRAIADPAGCDLPPAALLPLRRDGTPDLRGVVVSLAREPRQLPALLRLAADTRAALEALRRAAPLLAEALSAS